MNANNIKAPIFRLIDNVWHLVAFNDLEVGDITRFFDTFEPVDFGSIKKLLVVSKQYDSKNDGEVILEFENYYL